MQSRAYNGRSVLDEVFRFGSQRLPKHILNAMKECHVGHVEDNDGDSIRTYHDNSPLIASSVTAAWNQFFSLLLSPSAIFHVSLSLFGVAERAELSG